MRRWLLLVLLVLAGSPAFAPPVVVRFVQWSDVHWGNEESQPKAWSEARLEGLREAPQLVVLSGDQADNKCSTDEFSKRQEVILADIASHVGKVPLVFTLGNNDLSQNYQTPPEVLGLTLAAYRRHFAECPLDDLGNGVWPKPIAGMTWIAINSIVFSPLNRYSGRPQQAHRTLAWLEARLAAVPAGRTTVIVTHIPPTVDVFDGKPSWHTDEIDALAAILEKHASPVLFLCGHYHRNEIHAFSLKKRIVPVLITGSLSEKFGNQPNWRRWEWTVGSHDEPQRMAYHLYYPGHHDWDDVYTIDKPLDDAWYSHFLQQLQSDDEAYDAYMRDLWAHNLTWRLLSDTPTARNAVHDQFWWPLLPAVK